MVLDKCPKAGCHVTVKRKGWKPFRMVYGLDHNIKVVSLQYIFAQSMGSIRHLQILIGRNVCHGSKVFYLISLPKLL
ncbi:hypothetical protein AYX14_03323 [Cryptococcus neoformans]|nr:hypothetical protein AYX14_03323 [Cryptococcus neoformans var. grubii]